MVDSVKGKVLKEVKLFLKLYGPIATEFARVRFCQSSVINFDKYP